MIFLYLFISKTNNNHKQINNHRFEKHVLQHSDYSRGIRRLREGHGTDYRRSICLFEDVPCVFIDNLRHVSDRVSSHEVDRNIY